MSGAGETLNVGVHDRTDPTALQWHKDPCVLCLAQKCGIALRDSASKETCDLWDVRESLGHLGEGGACIQEPHLGLKSLKPNALDHPFLV